MNIFNFLKNPIIKNITPILFVVLMFFMVYALYSDSRDFVQIIKSQDRVTSSQMKLIEKLALKDTYKIENSINDAKVKKGGEIKLIPESELEVSNIEITQDSIKEEAQEKERTWIGRRFKSIGNLFKNDSEQ